VECGAFPPLFFLAFHRSEKKETESGEASPHSKTEHAAAADSAMKRHGQLWDRLTSFPNLLRAAEAARRGKRQRGNVVRVRRLRWLRRGLARGTLTPADVRARWAAWYGQ
jgi:hypothetical protein